MNNDNLTRTKLTRIIFHIALFTLFLLLIGTNMSMVAQPLSGAETKAVKPTAWQLTQQGSHMSLVPEMKAEGAIQVTLRKSLSDCTASTLNISLKSLAHELHDFIGEELIFNIQLHDTAATIRLQTSHVNTSGDTQRLHLRPFLINNDLSQDLMHHEQLQLELLAPVGLVRALDTPSLTVDVSTLKSAYQKMADFCSVVVARSESAKHYTQLLDVL